MKLNRYKDFSDYVDIDLINYNRETDDDFSIRITIFSKPQFGNGTYYSSENHASFNSLEEYIEKKIERIKSLYETDKKKLVNIYMERR